MWLRIRNQADATLVRRVRIRPLQEDTEAGSGTEIRNVNERQNTRRPIQPFTQKLPDVRDRLVSAGRRDLP